MNRDWRGAAGLALALALPAAVSSCGEWSGPGGAGALTELRISANLLGAPIDTVIVEVSAADIPLPLLFNLDIVNGTAQGTIAVPAGSARTISVRTFDTNGIETHSGAVTINIDPGTNPNVTITLVPRAGSQPIVVTVTNIVITLTPDSATLDAGDTLRILAAVTDPSGMPLSRRVTWATGNPGVASVDTAGLVTALTAGQTRIVATAAGVAAVSWLTVTAASPPPPPPPPPTVAPCAGWCYPTSVPLPQTPNLGAGIYFVDRARGWAVYNGGRILATADGGVTWSEQSSGVTADLRDVFFLDAQRGWVVGTGGTVLHTGDGGATWAAQTSGVTATLQRVRFFDASTGWILLPDRTSLRTTDGGATWTAAGQPVTDGGALSDVHWFSSTSAIAAVGANGLYGRLWRTDDGGATWTFLSEIGNVSTGRYPLSISFVSPGTGYALTQFALNLGGNVLRNVLKTVDGGATWSAIAWCGGDARMIRFVDAQHGWLMSGNPFAPVTTVCRTADGGATWTPVSFNSPFAGGAVFALDQDHLWLIGPPNGGSLAATVVRSTNGGQ